MKLSIVAVFMVAMVTGCAIGAAQQTDPLRRVGLSDAQKETVRIGMRSRLKDPESARFGLMMAGRNESGGITVCGYVNAKNSYGGYTGSKPYIGILHSSAFSLVELGDRDSALYAVKTQCARYGLNL